MLHSILCRLSVVVFVLVSGVQASALTSDELRGVVCDSLQIEGIDYVALTIYQEQLKVDSAPIDGLMKTLSHDPESCWAGVDQAFHMIGFLVPSRSIGTYLSMETKLESNLRKRVMNATSDRRADLENEVLDTLLAYYTGKALIAGRFNRARLIERYFKDGFIKSLVARYPSQNSSSTERQVRYALASVALYSGHGKSRDLIDSTLPSDKLGGAYHVDLLGYVEEIEKMGIERWLRK